MSVVVHVYQEKIFFYLCSKIVDVLIKNTGIKNTFISKNIIKNKN